jgi:hypothetical protein
MAPVFPLLLYETIRTWTNSTMLAKFDQIIHQAGRLIKTIKIIILSTNLGRSADKVLRS